MPGTDITTLLRSITLDKDKGKALPFLSALNLMMITQGLSSCSTEEKSVVSMAEVMYDYALLLDTLRKKKNLRQLKFMTLGAHRFGYPGKLTGVSE